VFASQFHLLSHALFKALLFLGAGAVIHGIGTRDLGKMGGLGKEMPFVRNVFVIGAMALAGLPILNGFWSKELVLEAGLVGGPLWAYAGMLLGAGMTALYTARVVWLVFYGPARTGHGGHPVHDAPLAMRIALGALAFGTLSSWLLAGPLGDLLETTLPFHDMHVETTEEIVAEIVSAPATWVALAVVGLGMAGWWQRQALAGWAARLAPFRRIAAGEFGFEWLNRRVVHLVRNVAEAARATQTGQLNWNVVGIVGALAIVLGVLMGGAR
jgi:NADH-quinone oxidoreductase subunit L